MYSFLRFCVVTIVFLLCVYNLFGDNGLKVVNYLFVLDLEDLHFSTYLVLFAIGSDVSQVGLELYKLLRMILMIFLLTPPRCWYITGVHKSTPFYFLSG